MDVEQTWTGSCKKYPFSDNTDATLSIDDIEP